MNILTVIPTQRELEAFIETCRTCRYQSEGTMVGKIMTTFFPALGVTVAAGGLGKAQFAVQTQHLIEAGTWDVVICAGSAGALVEQLSIEEVVVGTETVEHDIHSWGPPLVPRFEAAKEILDVCRQLRIQDVAFRIHYGPIASGDESVMDEARRVAIHERTQALAVAWEGAGGARASQFSGVSFVEIRGVSDEAGPDARHDFARYLKGAMGNVARVIIALAQQGLMSGQEAER